MMITLTFGINNKRIRGEKQIGRTVRFSVHPPRKQSNTKNIRRHNCFFLLSSYNKVLHAFFFIRISRTKKRIE